MIENRRAYRIPFRTKFVFGTPSRVYTGNSLNISAGGIYVATTEQLPRETHCKVLFQLSPSEDPVWTEALVKRVAAGTADPEFVPGLGFQFTGKENNQVQKKIEEFMEESRKNYEVAATILSSGEPDVASLQQFLSRMHLPPFSDLGELRQYIERVLRAIELVETAKSREI